MDVAAVQRAARLLRFRRASEPPAFRLTDDDVEIIRQLARCRLIPMKTVVPSAADPLSRTTAGDLGITGEE